MDIILKYFSDFTAEQEQQFRQLDGLYRDWNDKINLISRKDIDSLYEKHILHSLALAVLCSFKPGAKVVDIGTGGGFPGIPLAIFFPDVEFLLVDSIGKKIKVVSDVAEKIGLKNVTAIHGRAEELKGRKFDFAVSRAVAPLGELWGWISQFLVKGHASEELPNGLICLKGGDLEAEIKQSDLPAQAWSVHDIFEEEFFKEKYAVYVPK